MKQWAVIPLSSICVFMWASYSIPIMIALCAWFTASVFPCHGGASRPCSRVLGSIVRLVCLRIILGLGLSFSFSWSIIWRPRNLPGHSPWLLYTASDFLRTHCLSANPISALFTTTLRICVLYFILQSPSSSLESFISNSNTHRCVVWLAKSVRNPKGRAPCFMVFHTTNTKAAWTRSLFSAV